MPNFVSSLAAIFITLPFIGYILFLSVLNNSLETIDDPFNLRWI